MSGGKALQGNLGRLRFNLAFFSVVAVFLICLGHLWIAPSWGREFAISWAIVAIAALGVQVIVLWSDLHLNKRKANGSVLPSFGLATWISLTRLFCLSLLIGFLALPHPASQLAWLPLALCLFFNLSDFVDGYAARVTNRVTPLGQKMDQDLDGRGLLVGSLLVFQYGAVGWWFILVGAARYLFVFGLWVRRRRGQRIDPLRPKPGRRALAGTQMGVATAMLAPILSHSVTVFASTLFMVPFLWNFYLDWLQVSGQTKLEERFRQFQIQLMEIGQPWLPLILRTLLTSLLVWFAFSGSISGRFAGVELALAALIALGLTARLASIGVLIEMAIRLQSQSLQVSEIIAIACATGILFLGSGTFSLWLPEQTWAFRRPGEKLSS